MCGSSWQVLSSLGAVVAVRDVLQCVEGVGGGESGGLHSTLLL